jgi:hypothetical protein
MARLGAAERDLLFALRGGVPWSDERRFAVTFENIMGIKLCELACDGRKILRAERGMPGADGAAWPGG